MLRDLVPSNWTRLPWHGRPEFKDPFVALRQEMNRLFDELWSDFGSPAGGPAGRSLVSAEIEAPRIDVSEDEKEYLVTAELPGLDEKNIQVEYASGVLTIRGEAEHQKEENGKRFYLKERSYGVFQRNLALPFEIDEDKVKASFKNGVLTVTLPKSQAAQSKVKRIPLTH